MLSGGIEVVSAGAVASGTVIDSGGRESVLGTTSGTSINSGGTAIVSSGGTASATTISGGVLEVMSGGSVAGGPVTFGGGGTFVLDASTSFTGTISAFTIPDQLDLRDIVFGSATTATFKEASRNTSGTLTISDGTHTADLTMLGTYVTSQFHLGSDGHGGTLVTDPPATSRSSMQVSAYSHIVVVMEENHSYNEIIGNTANGPYINNTLAAGGAVMGNYFAISHPSEPNYLALYAGSDFGITDDNFHSEVDPSLDTILQGAGKTFTGYVDTAGGTDQNHNPWEYFPEGTSVETGFTSFPALFPSGDFSSLPTVSFVIPGVNDDMHNGTIQAGDSWLQSNLGTYAQWATSNNSLLIVAWDEDDGTQNNQVPAIFYGADVNPGVYTATSYNHYNLLSTILASSGLTGPRNAAAAAPIAEIFTPCFCRGMLILTPRGEIPVEQLRVGDRVLTLEGEEQPITWIGHGRRTVTSANSNARPLIVRRDALEEGMPCRDLCLTRGHGLLLDGMLIPVEFLVNGASIMWDSEAREVEYYHFELATHEIIFANGTPAETYREDGNRDWFDNVEPPFFSTEEMTWYAPVVTGGPELDRVWRRLLDRSGFVAPTTTDDPDLHLLADRRRIDPISVEHRMHCFQGLYRFRLEQAPRQLSIASRSMVPQLMGVNHDPRQVGVAVRSITLAGDSCTTYIDYDSPRLNEGFNQPEMESELRWTSGRGQVPETALALFSSSLEITIDIVCTGKYPVSEDRADEIGARSNRLEMRAEEARSTLRA